MGDGIGFKRNTSIGTLGGFFKLQSGDKVYRGFLTSHRVVAQSTGADSTQVAYPSQLDATITQKELTAGKIDLYKTLNTVNNDERRQEVLELYGTTTE